MPGGRGGNGEGRKSKNRAKGEEAGHNTGKTYAQLQQEQIKRDKNPQRKVAIPPNRPKTNPGGARFAQMQSDKIGGKGKGKDRE